MNVPPIQPKPMTYSHPATPLVTNQTSMPTTTKELNLQHDQKEEEPFFVRIDKFNSSKENFLTINSKVKELENILSTLERIKEKEDREFEGWKNQTTSIKELLSQIDKEIFGKL